jgi:hypothetical protein
MKKRGVLFHSHIFFFYDNNNIGKKLISFDIYYCFTHAGLGENSQREREPL